MDTILWIVIGAICGVGLLSNVTSLAILVRQSNKQSVTYWLMALAVVDLVGLSCSSLLADRWPRLVADEEVAEAGGDGLIDDVLLTVQHVVCSLHVLFLLGTCADRYLAIAWPEAAKTKPIVAIVVLAVASTSLHLPGYVIGVPEPGISRRRPTEVTSSVDILEVTTTRQVASPTGAVSGLSSGDHTFPQATTNEHAMSPEVSITGYVTTDHDNDWPAERLISHRQIAGFDVNQMRDHVVYRWLYVFGIRIVALFTLPVLALAVFLFMLVVQSCTSRQKFSRKRSTKGKYFQTLSYAFIVIGKTSICLVCALPLVVYDIVYSWMGIEVSGLTNQVVHVVRTAAYFVLISVNFCVYLAVDGKFRKNLCQCIQCKC